MPIRDETLREGLVRLGAVIERKGLPTTSPLPRYALAAHFAALLHPELFDETLTARIAQWQEANLSPGALARIAIIRRGRAGGTGAGDLPQRRNPRHGARAKLGALENGGGGIHGALP